MNRLLIGLMLIVPLGRAAYGAIVEWNCFRGYTQGDVYWSGNDFLMIEYRGNSSVFNPSTLIEFERPSDKRIVLLGKGETIEHIGAGYSMTFFMRAYAGDVINKEMFESATSMFQRLNDVPGYYSVSSDYDITVAPRVPRTTQTVYLAFCTWGNGGYGSTVGWVAIDVNPYIGYVELSESAMSLDGGSLVVGEPGLPLPYAADTPEPSSALLLLVGVGLLALQRRRVAR